MTWYDRPSGRPGLTAVCLSIFLGTTLGMMGLLTDQCDSQDLDTPESALPENIEVVDCELVRRYSAPAATQAVAVDVEHFYAIGNSRIVKRRKEDGQVVARWSASDELPLTHLNSGLVRDGRLYCCHSNFPRFPETSSVEIFDAETLQHVDSHSFGIYEGSLTWIDWHNDAWWAVFAHYSKAVNDDPHSKSHAYTALVKFDRQWRRLGGWVFPNSILARFDPHSCSGGFWGPGERLCVTGHDRHEIYGLELPRAGSEMEWVSIIPAQVTGQGIAWEREEGNESAEDSLAVLLYGISRSKREVVVSRVELRP